MKLQNQFLNGFLFCYLGLSLALSAQTSEDPRLVDLQVRFKQGLAYENEGKLKEALDIFLGIIKDEPQARGSLFYAGLVLVEMDQPEQALDYLTKFRALEPKDFKGIVLMIQANQALRRGVKVESLRKELLELRTTENIPGLTDAKSYTREQILGDKGALTVMSEFFDYQTAPNILYQGEQKGPDGETLRRLFVFFNSDETKSARAKNAKFADVEVFDLSEEVILNGKSVQLNIYRQEYEKPTYETARNWILDAIKEPPKPLMTAPLAPNGN